jgi:tetratricopeptide (TPR) repeat protein
VSVNVVSQRTSSVRYNLTTDKNGKFMQIGLTPGDYIVQFAKEGFAPAAREVHVGIDETTEVEIELKSVNAEEHRALSEADKAFLKGNKLYADQKYAEAAAAYASAIALDPQNWRYYLNLGLSDKKLAKPEEALAAFKKAVDLSPESFSANKETGEALAKAGLLAEARPYYEKAVSLNPDDPNARYNSGLCLVAAGEPEEALAQFRRAVELDPNYADAYYEIGTLMISQNKVAEAVANLEKFVALAPDNPRADIARRLLEALKK